MSLLTALLVAAADPKLPEWMAGCWEYRSGERWTEECWTVPRAGMMMGSGRTGIGEKLVEWETMQITLDHGAGNDSVTGMAFRGAPKGMNATVFAWSPSQEPGVEFGNAAHDYPQRIRYWREGEELVAEISLADGSRPVRWRYRRMGS